MCVKLNSLFDREMEVYYGKHMIMQGVNIKGCVYYILEYKNTTSQLL